MFYFLNENNEKERIRIEFNEEGDPIIHSGPVLVELEFDMQDQMPRFYTVLGFNDKFLDYEIYFPDINSASQWAEVILHAMNFSRVLVVSQECDLSDMPEFGVPRVFNKDRGKTKVEPVEEELGRAVPF